VLKAIKAILPLALPLNIQVHGSRSCTTLSDDKQCGEGTIEGNIGFHTTGVQVLSHYGAQIQWRPVLLLAIIVLVLTGGLSTLVLVLDLSYHKYHHITCHTQEMFQYISRGIE
jgi:hypothetical protein